MGSYRHTSPFGDPSRAPGLPSVRALPRSSPTVVARSSTSPAPVTLQQYPSAPAAPSSPPHVPIPAPVSPPRPGRSSHLPPPVFPDPFPAPDLLISVSALAG